MLVVRVPVVVDVRRSSLRQELEKRIAAREARIAALSDENATLTKKVVEHSAAAADASASLRRMSSDMACSPMQVRASSDGGAPPPRPPTLAELREQARRRAESFLRFLPSLTPVEWWAPS